MGYLCHTYVSVYQCLHCEIYSKLVLLPENCTHLKKKLVKLRLKIIKINYN